MTLVKCLYRLTILFENISTTDNNRKISSSIRI
jgi:hypothetical protein